MNRAVICPSANHNECSFHILCHIHDVKFIHVHTMYIGSVRMAALISLNVTMHHNEVYRFFSERTHTYRSVHYRRWNCDELNAGIISWKVWSRWNIHFVANPNTNNDLLLDSHAHAHVSHVTSLINQISKLIIL